MTERKESAFWSYEDLALLLSAILPCYVGAYMLVRLSGVTSKEGQTLILQSSLYCSWRRCTCWLPGVTADPSGGRWVGCGRFEAPGGALWADRCWQSASPCWVRRFTLRKARIRSRA